MFTTYGRVRIGGVRIGRQSWGVANCIDELVTGSIDSCTCMGIGEREYLT